MGLLDLPAPLFDFVDRSLLGALPPLARLILWAIAGAAVSLTLYRWLSPQRRIAAAKAAALDARRRLNAHDGDLESALPLMRQSMKAALRHVGLVFPAALIASLPVLALLVWLDGAYGYQLPQDRQAPAVSVEPAGFSGQWQANGSIAVRDQGGAEVAHLTLAEPITRIEKRQWWTCDHRQSGRLSAGAGADRQRHHRAAGAAVSPGRSGLAAILADGGVDRAGDRLAAHHAHRADRVT